MPSRRGSLSLLVATLLLIFLIVVGYVFDLTDVTTQLAAGVIREKAGIPVADVSLVFYIRYGIYLMAAGLAAFIILKVATAIRRG